MMLFGKVLYNGAIQKHATGLVWYCCFNELVLFLYKDFKTTAQLFCAV